MKQNNKKVAFIACVIITFILTSVAGILIMLGAMFDRNNVIYAGLTLLMVGFVFYIILFIVLCIVFRNKYSDRS